MTTEKPAAVISHRLFCFMAGVPIGIMSPEGDRHPAGAEGRLCLPLPIDMAEMPIGIMSGAGLHTPLCRKSG